MSKIRVLSVDDSALMRQIMTEIINSHSDMEMVATAPDPLVARDLIKKFNPDVLTLDVEMPRMDGLDFLEKLMRLRPMPVVMVSSLTGKGSEVTLRALELGAIDFVTKPQLGIREGMLAYSEMIAEKVRTAAKASLAAHKPLSVPTTLKAGPLLSSEKLIAIGASTGGFTDVALQNGAKLVYALDVGYNQLAWKLRDNPQVIVMEKQNFRYSKPADFTDGLPDFAMTDVSFISLDLIMPPMYEILKDQCDAVCLIKPQFEAGPENVGKHGIVHDHDVHANVIKHTMQMAQKIGFNILGVDYSPIKGGKGNIEFLIHLGKDLANPGQDLWQGSPVDVVQRAVSGL